MWKFFPLSLQLFAAMTSLGAFDVPKVVPQARGGVFTVAETPAVALSGNADGRVVWRLLDWKREKLRIGEWPKGGQLSFGGLPQGYYFVQARLVDAANATNIPLREATFCVVPDPKTRTYPFDSFYGTDAALSWVCAPQQFIGNWYGDNSFKACLDLIRLSGLPHLRERLSWCEVSDKPGEYHWGRYLQNARFAEERGLKVSGVFHDSPSYAECMQKGPADMAALYRFCRDAAKTFGGAMGDWEFWNEQNQDFWPEPVWDYMSAMKTAYLGFRAADPKIIVLNGAPTGEPWDAFGEMMMENDLAKYSNVFNIHNYGTAVTYPGYFEKLRSFLGRHGLADRQVWITESSATIDGHATGEGLRPGLKAQTYAQEMVLAELYAKNRVYMQMQGVARDYFFVFGAYNEMDGALDWGVLRRDGSAKPVFSAISTMTELLADAKLEGEVSVGEGVKCFVFAKPDGSQTLVHWAVSPCDTAKSSKDGVTARQLETIERTFSLELPDGGYPTANWCGERGRVMARNGRLNLTASRYAAYVTGVKGVRADVRALPRGKIEEYRPASDEDLSVVMRIEFDRKDFSVSKNVVGLEGDGGKVKVRIWNFSDTEKRGSLSGAGCALEDAPAEIVLPPNGVETAVAATVRFVDPTNTLAKLVLTGVFNGKRTSRLVVPVRSDKALLAQSKVVYVKSNDVKFWDRNDSAEETTVSWDEKEQAVRFDCDWKNSSRDRWFYPTHRFRDREESFDGAVLLEFEVKMESNKAENDVSVSLCMLLNEPKGEKRHLDYQAPCGSWEKRRVVLSDADGNRLGDGMTAFRIGCNPRGTRMTYWIRNLRIIKPVKRPPPVRLSRETDEERARRMSWWTHDRFGMFIHFGLYALPARHEWVKSIERMDDATYDRYFDRFDPDRLDVREWVRQAKRAGMRYVVLTTKHHEGFCLFDSKLTDYKITRTKYGKDLVREFVDACRAEGLRVGFYYSLPDWHHPEFPVDHYHPRRPVNCGPWDQAGLHGPDAPWEEVNRGRDMSKYREYLYGQVTELLTNYGKIDLLWFDFTMEECRTKHAEDWQSEKLLELVRRLQPEIIVNDRLGLGKTTLDGWDFVTPEQNVPKGPEMRHGKVVPWETCQTFSGSWGYHRDENTWKTPKECLEVLIRAVAHGGNLIMNVGPTGRGDFDGRARDRLEVYAKWMADHARSIYGCSAVPDGFTAPVGTLLTYDSKAGRLYLHLVEYPDVLPLRLDFADRIGYAQFLNDASEVLIEDGALKLPTNAPDVVIPVVELALK